MSTKKKTLGRSALSCEVEDGLLDIDQILNTDPWKQIDDFVQCNFIQDILNDFSELITLDPERVPDEQKKKQRTVQSKVTPQKTGETFVESKASNKKASTGEKLKVKIGKPWIKKKNNEKSIGDSGKIEKEKLVAGIGKKGAGKSVKDRKSQGNSPGANTSSIVAMSSDESKACETRSRASSAEKMAETTEGTSEMASQDVLGFSFEASMPTGESSRIDEIQMETNVTKMSETPISNEPCATVTGSPNVSELHSETISNSEEDKRRERKSLGRSRRECSGGEGHLEHTVEEEVQEQELDKTKKRRRSSRTPKHTKDTSIGKNKEKNISKVASGTRGGLKSFGRSKSSKEKETVETIVEETPSTSQDETVVTKRGRKSLRLSHRFKEQHPTDGEFSEQTKAKKRWLSGTAESSKEKEKEKNISDEEPNEEKKKRKSLPDCSKEEQNPVEKQLPEDREKSVAKKKTKSKSLGGSKCSKGNAEKTAEKNNSTRQKGGDVEKERPSTSSGMSKSSEGQDREKSVAEKKTKSKSLEVSKCSKEDAVKTAEKNNSTSQKGGDVEKERPSTSSGMSKSSEGQDREKSVAEKETKRKSLEVSKCSKEDAVKTAEKNNLTSQKGGDVEKERPSTSSGMSKSSEGQDREKSVAEKETKRKSLEGSKCSKEDAGEKSNGEKQEGKCLGKSKCTKQEKNSAEDVQTEPVAGCSRTEMCPSKKAGDGKTGEEKPESHSMLKLREKGDDKSSATEGREISKHERRLLEKRKKRKEKRIKKREKKAARAIGEFSHQVTAIAKDMGYLEEKKSESSDTSDYCVFSDHSHDSIFSDNSVSSDNSFNINKFDNSDTSDHHDNCDNFDNSDSSDSPVCSNCSVSSDSTYSRCPSNFDENDDLSSISGPSKSECCSTLSSDTCSCSGHYESCSDSSSSCSCNDSSGSSDDRSDFTSCTE